MPLTDLEKQQHELLREIEWRGGAGWGDVCPSCLCSKPIHDRDCKLKNVLAAAAQQATSTAHESRTDRLQQTQSMTDISQLQPAPFPSTPLCPQCQSKAIYISAESYPDRSRVCSCHNGHTWALNAQGVEI